MVVSYRNHSNFADQAFKQMERKPVKNVEPVEWQEDNKKNK